MKQLMFFSGIFGDANFGLASFTQLVSLTISSQIRHTVLQRLTETGKKEFESIFMTVGSLKVKKFKSLCCPLRSAKIKKKYKDQP